jgi:hypothetical protein
LQHFQNQVIAGGQPHDVLAVLASLGRINFGLQHTARLKKESNAQNQTAIEQGALDVERIELHLKLTPKTSI